MSFSKKKLESCDISPVEIDQDFLPYVIKDAVKNEVKDFFDKISQSIMSKRISEKWWFEEISEEYLSGNMKSWIIRIKKYGIKHFL